MGERTLIFYSTTGPDSDAAAWRPFNFASRAIRAGLDCEIVLAGPGTGLMRRDARNRLEGSALEAYEHVVSAGVPVWLAPG